MIKELLTDFFLSVVKIVFLRIFINKFCFNNRFIIYSKLQQKNHIMVIYRAFIKALTPRDQK